jgi:hypothetical protein
VNDSEQVGPVGGHKGQRPGPHLVAPGHMMSREPGCGRQPREQKQNASARLAEDVLSLSSGWRTQLSASPRIADDAARIKVDVIFLVALRPVQSC